MLDSRLRGNDGRGPGITEGGHKEGGEKVSWGIPPDPHQREIPLDSLYHTATPRDQMVYNSILLVYLYIVVMNPIAAYEKSL
jgi:hypothetical protein